MKENKGQIISIANLKGGVGKTTTAQNLGAGLKRSGKNVLFVDMDIRQNLTFALNGSDEYGSIYDLLQGADIKTAIQKTPSGDLIRGDFRLSNYDVPEEQYKEILKPLRSIYDYILIDTPPNNNTAVSAALAASDSVIIPVQANVFSVQGLFNEAETIKAYECEIAGVLVTNYEKRGTFKRDYLEAIREECAAENIKMFNTVIRKNVAIEKAQSESKNIFDYDSRSNGAKDYAEFVKEVLKNE